MTKGERKFAKTSIDKSFLFVLLPLVCWINKKQREKLTATEYIDRYSLSDLSKKDVIQKIAKDIAGSGLTKEGLANKSNINLEVCVLNLETIVEQNWIILKQLEKLNSNKEGILLGCLLFSS